MRLAFVLLTCGWVALAACTNAGPCQSCPPIDGTYAVNWADAGTLEDGGVTTCPGPRVPTWTFTGKQPSQVLTTIEGVTLGGTLYDTYDLLLTGSGSGVSYRLRGLVIPEGTSVDAGVRLQGTFTTRTSPSTGAPCESAETFTAQRTSR